MGNVGAGWSPYFPDKPLISSEQQVRSFASAMGESESIIKSSTSKTSPLTQDQFAPGGDVNGVKLFYFCGHGSPASIDIDNDDGTKNTEDRVDADEMRLGESLEWIVLDSCFALNPQTIPDQPQAAQATINYWRSAFSGLRGILGFTGETFGFATRGQRFAELLQQGASMRVAWRMACEESEIATDGKPEWASLSLADDQGNDAADDVWGSRVALSSPVRLRRRARWDAPAPAFSPPAPNEVTIFRARERTHGVPKGDFSSLRESFAPRRGPRPARASSHFENGDGEWLEVFGASSSLRWRRYGLLSKPPRQASNLHPGQVRSAAESFLSKSAPSFLDAHVRGPSVGARSMEEVGYATLFDDADDRVRIVSHSVTYRETCGGLPIVGPGGRVVVTVDAAGQPIELCRLSRDVGDVVRRGRPCLQQAEEHRVKLAREHGTAVGMRLAYLHAPPTEVQDWFVPYFVFSYRAAGGRFGVEVLPAIKASSEQLEQFANLLSK